MGRPASRVAARWLTIDRGIAMYLAHWGLTRPAFTTIGDPEAYCLTPTHAEACARIEYLVDQHRRLGLLVGAAGAGKSMTLAHVSRKLDRQRHRCVTLSTLGIDYDEFMWKLASRLGATLRASYSMKSV